MSSMGIGSKPCLDIRPSNNQISDRSIPLTQLNKSKSLAKLEMQRLTNSFTAPKLRHAEPGKGSMRRPNSLISESSLSSGTSTTSSSSMSGGCSSSHASHETGRHSLNLSFSKLSSNSNNSSSPATLELINETQALKLTSSSEQQENSAAARGQATPTPTLTSSGSNRSNKRQHKRSTTIVSQLSMGIELELCYFF